MEVHIYSLKRPLFEGNAKAITCTTTSGEITVLDHHHPLISVLKAGTITLRTHEGKELKFSVAQGFIEVRDSNQARLIVEEE